MNLDNTTTVYCSDLQHLEQWEKTRLLEAIIGHDYREQLSDVIIGSNYRTRLLDMVVWMQLSKLIDNNCIFAYLPLKTNK